MKKDLDNPSIISYNCYNKLTNLKTVKRRVGIRQSLSELVMVGAQYKVYIEEHL